MFDTHCHLDLAAFDADRPLTLERAARAGVRDVLIPAIRPRTWADLGHLAAEPAPARVHHALGVHPQIVPELDVDEAALAQDPDALARALVEGNAIAVGECGLDGGTEARDRQEAILRAHVRAARATGLPLVIHVLRAHDAAPRILREEKVAQVGGVMHSYSGGAALVPVYRDLGLCFSFAGPVTYPGARRPLEAARAVPDDLLLAETDAPDQAPFAQRGHRSEPAFLPLVIEGLAHARGQDAAELRASTDRNARRLFRVQ